MAKKIAEQLDKHSGRIRVERITLQCDSSNSANEAVRKNNKNKMDIVRHEETGVYAPPQRNRTGGHLPTTVCDAQRSGAW